MYAAGSGAVEMYGSPVVARLTYISGGQFWADYIEFKSTIAVESHSWGAIKNLYR